MSPQSGSLARGEHRKRYKDLDGRKPVPSAYRCQCEGRRFLVQIRGILARLSPSCQPARQTVDQCFCPESVSESCLGVGTQVPKFRCGTTKRPYSLVSKRKVYGPSSQTLPPAMSRIQAKLFSHASKGGEVRLGLLRPSTTLAYPVPHSDGNCTGDPNNLGERGAAGRRWRLHSRSLGENRHVDRCADD
jgi:hypothetical protein